MFVKSVFHFMISNALEGLFNQNDNIRCNAEHFLIQFRDNDLKNYICELHNVLSEKNSDNRIRQASIVLIGQAINSGIGSLDVEFLSNLADSVSLEINPSNSPEVSYHAANLYGEIIGALVRANYKNDNIIQNLANSLLSSNNLSYLKYLLITVTGILRTSNLEAEHISILFQSLYHLTLNPDCEIDALKAIYEMTDDLPLVKNDNLLNMFLQQLLDRTKGNVIEKKVICYKIWKRFVKTAPVFIKGCLNEVVFQSKIDIMTEYNEESDVVLLASLDFIKKIFELQRKSVFNWFNYIYFDEFLDPLLNIFFSYQCDELDTNEFKYPQFEAQDILHILVINFPEHASKVLIPRIEYLSQQASPILNEGALLLLSFLILHSSVLPPNDFIISYINYTISSTSLRVRFASLRTLKCYLKRNESNEKCLFLMPKLIERIDDHTAIAHLSLTSLTQLSSLPNFPAIDIFHVFFQIIYNTRFSSDSWFISYVFDKFCKIIDNREMKEVIHILEPSITLLYNYLEMQHISFDQVNQYEFLSNNKVTGNGVSVSQIMNLICTILYKVTIAGIEYLPVIFNLFSCVDNTVLCPDLVLSLGHLSKCFQENYEPYFSKTIQIVEHQLSIFRDSFEDMDIICYGISTLSLMKYFIPYLQKIVPLLLEIFNSGNHAAIIGLSALFEFYPNELASLAPTLLQFASVVLQEVIEKREEDKEDYIIRSIIILNKCYEMTNDETLVPTIINFLDMVDQIDPPSLGIIQEIMELILSLDDEISMVILEKTHSLDHLILKYKELAEDEQN